MLSNVPVTFPSDGRAAAILPSEGGGSHYARISNRCGHRRSNADDCLRDACSQDRGGHSLEVGRKMGSGPTPRTHLNKKSNEKARAPTRPGFFGGFEVIQ